MKRCKHIGTNLRSSLSQSRCNNLYSYQQYGNRYISQMFNYGSNDHQLIELEVSSFQHELHGEDSLFIHDNSSFGIADGVGGWNNVKGGNPKEFSRRVMNNCKKELESIINDCKGDGNAYLNSKELLIRAAMPVMNDESLLGGTTALIAMLINKNILSIANIGDSRFYLFRRFPDRAGRPHIPILYFQSPEQVYSFNAPMQLAPISNLAKNSLAVDPNLWTEYYELPITIGDIIVFVTDGVSDNLFPHELNQIIIDGYKQYMNNDKELSINLSKSIVNAAVNKQEGKSNNNQDTPFGLPKPDDTSVIVACCVSI